VPYLEAFMSAPANMLAVTVKRYLPFSHTVCAEVQQRQEFVAEQPKSCSAESMRAA
jgi:hypothetical protein